MEIINTASAQETIDAAERFAARLKPGDCVLYTGEMGAGKTHFTKGIAKHFGVADCVSSPTFALVNEYMGSVPVFHFDLFRINGFDDLYAIGFFDYLDRDGIICVEWSENVPTLADNLESVWHVDIRKSGGSTSDTGENAREITIDKRV